jgi:hypothetical protein
VSHAPEPIDPKINLDTKDHVSASVYIMPEEAIALRKELYDNWRAEPASFAGENGQALWYYSGLMITDPPAFVELMALELGLPLVFDSFNEAGICKQILNALRKKRGVSEL